MTSKRHLNKIHRYLTGECTREEKEWLEKWIEEDPANRQTFEAVKKIWEVEPEKELKTDLKLAWQRLEKQIGNKEEVSAGSRVSDLKPGMTRNSGSGSRAIWLRVAAILVIGLFLSLYVIKFVADGTGTDNDTIEYTERVMQEITTDRAHQSKMTFTDGTVVRLNAASLIRFPQQFDSDVREVYLEGEAWFDVRHNPDVEFIVRTRDATVQVLGTEFNVRAHPEDPEVEVVVADGTVAVQASSGISDDPDSVVLLTKGEMSRVKPGQAPTDAQQVDVHNYFSWLRGVFLFEEVPFARVLNEWERRFDVDFEVENETLLGIPFTGEFRHESFDEMLRLTSITLEFDYNRENNTITINK